jgi:hypothetical protein
MDRARLYMNVNLSPKGYHDQANLRICIPEDLTIFQGSDSYHVCRYVCKSLEDGILGSRYYLW